MVSSAAEVYDEFFVPIEAARAVPPGGGRRHQPLESPYSLGDPTALASLLAEAGVDDAQFERLVAEAEQALRRFAAPDGSVRFDHPASIASATKP